MKKYKLIKEYPRCPIALDEVVTYSKESDEYISKCNRAWIAPWEITNYPEFWEEVKGYEILSFSNKETVNLYPLYVLKDDGLYHYVKGSLDHPPSKSTEEELLNLNRVEIHQVKRTSDNEVFTVGDKVEYKQKSSYGSWIIDNFFVRRDKKLLARNQNNIICEYIDDISKVQEPLFTTEDGYDVYEGEKCYVVCTSNELSFVPYNVFNTKPFLNDNDFVHFKKKENAEKWIEDNKPQYSKKDIQDAINSVKCWGVKNQQVGTKKAIWLIHEEDFWKSLNDRT